MQLPAEVEAPLHRRLRALKSGGGLKAVPAAETNQRWARRRRTDLPGYIVSAKLSNVMRCTLRDSSCSGALIQVQLAQEHVSTADLPDEFTMVLMQYRERTEVECVVVRRSGNLLGVRYTSAFKVTQQSARYAEVATTKTARGR